MKTYCSASGPEFCRRIEEKCFNCPVRQEQEIIDLIFKTRVRNNIPWKRLMEIALKHAPEETKIVLREINANDRAVSDLLAELAK